MTKSLKKSPRLYLGIIFLSIQVAWFCFIVNFFNDNNYLPSPFVSDKQDTFMDLMHPLFWSTDPGRYTEWQSIYPPLVFVILKVLKEIAFPVKDFSDAFEMRGESLGIIICYLSLAITSLLALFFSNLYKNLSSFEKLVWSIFVILSPPILFTLERGNILIFCPFILAIALITTSCWTQAITLAILINIKPYFVFLLLGFLIKKDIIGFMRGNVVAALMFITSGFYLDANFDSFLYSLFQFSSSTTNFDPSAILAMDSSLSIFSYIIRWMEVNQLDLIFDIAPYATISLVLKFINLAAIIGVIIGAFLSKKYFTFPQILSILCIVTTNFSYAFGGYTLILYVAIAPIIYFLKYGFQMVFICCVLFLPLDVIVLVDYGVSMRQLYYTGNYAEVSNQILLGAVLRPILNFSLLIFIMLEVFECAKGVSANSIGTKLSK